MTLPQKITTWCARLRLLLAGVGRHPLLTPDDTITLRTTDAQRAPELVARLDRETAAGRALVDALYEDGTRTWRGTTRLTPPLHRRAVAALVRRWRFRR